MSTTKHVDYKQSAEVFWSLSARRLPLKGSMRFRRFESLDLAVRFLLTDRSVKRFACTIDTDDAHYEWEDIRQLFARPDFPDLTIQHVAKPSRQFGLGFLLGVKAELAYAISRDPQGTWTVSSLATGQAVSINSVHMTRMSLPAAERMRDVLNSRDGQDMLAIGP
ncbi:hypothetical protein ACP4J4_08910 [Aureimonas ureilytica]|uniref:hypothetical protein n=1 Tax=Aureimonas ureilytica TaxID=401562 RepID=UPI003CFB3EB3